METLTARGLAISSCNFVHDLHGFFVFSLSHEVFWGFKDCETEDSQNELDHRDGAHNSHEISPPKIIMPRTLHTLLTREISQKWPCNQSSYHLRNCPIDAQNSQEVLMRTGQELEEDGRINRQIATNTKRPECGKTAYGSEIW